MEFAKEVCMQLSKAGLSMVVLALLTVIGCGDPVEPGDPIPGADILYEYGGSEPVGDLICVIINQSQQTVTHINYTSGQTNGPYTYFSMTTENGGFSILKVVDLPSLGLNGGSVLFAEYPGTAIVYQMFTNTDDGQSNAAADGYPVYAVHRQQTSAADYYQKSYNWMKFNTDTGQTNANMEAGFAAWDDSSALGLLYGAGYSKREELNGGSGMNNINSTGTIKLDDFIYDSASKSLVFWDGTAGDYSNALSLTGTPDGATILDFGPGKGGGAGLAIPQSSKSIADLDGTYFLINYNCEVSNINSGIGPMKMVIDSGHVLVYQFQDNTGTASSQWDGVLVDIPSYGAGPEWGDSTNLTTSLLNWSEVDTASSTLIQNAYMGEGSFVATNDIGTVFIMVDPDVRYLGFTGFFQEGPDEVIRFGFGIKDTGYSDAGL